MCSVMYLLFAHCSSKNVLSTSQPLIDIVRQGVQSSHYLQVMTQGERLYGSE